MSNLVGAVVARGVILQLGLDQNGQPSWAVPWVEYPPGSIVTLPQDEVDRLRQSGALVGLPIADRRNGPAV